MHVTLAGVGKRFGAEPVLSEVSLTIDSATRLAVVGPNGVGKSTLLRIAAGLEVPDAGAVTRAPATLAVGYLPQEPDARPDETLRGFLARRTGVADAERELETRATALARGADAGDAYAAALERFLRLGAPDFDARARTAIAELDLRLPLGRRTSGLSGGQRARAGLAAILLARFDVFLLDEPTNDLDLDGLARLERWVERVRGGLVVVSHDRAFLDRAVTRVAEIDPRSRRIREWAGGWSEYAATRERAREAAYVAYEEAESRRRALRELLAQRRGEARGAGASLGRRTGGADRRATRALASKVRQTERLLEQTELLEKPFEPWELRLSLRAGADPGDPAVSLEGAVAELGSFRLGPIDVSVGPGERIVVVGPNGSGKTTLLGLLGGVVPLTAGRRTVSSRTAVSLLAQERMGADGPLLEHVGAATGLAAEDARTLLAKFGLGVDDVLRPERSLSPGERTRARLAELQARNPNVLLLDEPTNHLDLEAIEQLELALSTYDGAAVVVSHDRRFLERIAPTREVVLGGDA